MSVLKRAAFFLLALGMVLSVAVLAVEITPQNPLEASQSDIDYLNGKYAGRVAYFGDLHDHSRDGLCEDGDTKYISEWLPAMDALDMDFQAMMNHHNIYHMYSEDWDDSRLIGGSEPATTITDSKATVKEMHYNMIVPNAQALINVVSSIPKFAYTGGKNGVPIEQGWFQYPSFTRAEMQDLIQKVKDQGGLWVHVHPKSSGVMQCDDPLEYWFADYTGLEVFYMDHTNAVSKANYKLWKDLLALGKRVWATAGCDLHDLPRAKTLNVIYSEKKDGATYVSHLREGDFTCGNVGVRMTVGDATMGGHTDFKDKRVVISIGDWHSSIAEDGREYTALIITGNGITYKVVLDPSTTNYFAFDADENSPFYRVEVYADNTLVSLGNPIWND